MRRRGWVLGACIAIGVTALGCESAKRAGEGVLYGINPVATTDALVLGVSKHGPYLLVALSSPLADLKFFAPASEVCLHVLEPNTRVNYAKSGVFGAFRRDDQICNPIGIASLEAWRDRQPRRTRRVVPRATAYYRVVQQDADLIFLRGRFTLASRVNIPGSQDLVAVLPTTEACIAISKMPQDAMEFRVSGPDPYRMYDNSKPCNVLGFAFPAEIPKT